MGTTRRLAAIMFTDITGYSAIMESDEVHAGMIRKRHREVFKEAHERYNGKILQYFGDGTLSIFDSTAAAVECAVYMQLEFRKNPAVPLRIGIHTGDIAYDDEGAYGDGLNIAARLEALCISGGIFISAKVFDDIKNHAWLTAVSLGYFHLHNISRDLEVFAVTSKDLPYPTSQELRSTNVHPNQYPEEDVEQGRKRKGVAFLLALPPMGVFGLHRFYLGQRRRGILHFVFASIGIFATIQDGKGWQILVILGIIGMVDAILMLAMPRVDFDNKYNALTGKTTQKYFSPPVKEKALYRTPERKVADPAIVKGINYYKQERYTDAIREFKRALEEDTQSAAAHFNLACCYSILKNADEAYYHLAKAVELGFDDYDRITHHEALGFLRGQDDFNAFKENKYQLIQQLEAGPQPDLLEQTKLSRGSVLDQLERLGDRLERGEMTRDEFDSEKRKLLGS